MVNSIVLYKFISQKISVIVTGLLNGFWEQFSGFHAFSTLKCSLTLLVFCIKVFIIAISFEEKLKDLIMSISGRYVEGSVLLAIFSMYVGFLLQEVFHYLISTLENCQQQWSLMLLGLAVDISTRLYEYFDCIQVVLIDSDVKRCS